MTNAAAIGYMILATKEEGLDKAAIRRLECQMIIAMDLTTEEEAEDAYENF